MNNIIGVNYPNNITKNHLAFKGGKKQLTKKIADVVEKPLLAGAALTVSTILAMQNGERKDKKYTAQTLLETSVPREFDPEAFESWANEYGLKCECTKSNYDGKCVFKDSKGRIVREINWCKFYSDPITDEMYVFDNNGKIVFRKLDDSSEYTRLSCANEDGFMMPIDNINGKWYCTGFMCESLLPRNPFTNEVQFTDKPRIYDKEEESIPSKRKQYKTNRNILKTEMPNKFNISEIKSWAKQHHLLFEYNKEEKCCYCTDSNSNVVRKTYEDPAHTGKTAYDRIIYYRDDIPIVKKVRYNNNEPDIYVCPSGRHFHRAAEIDGNWFDVEMEMSLLKLNPLTGEEQSLDKQSY